MCANISFYHLCNVIDDGLLLQYVDLRLQLILLMMGLSSYVFFFHTGKTEFHYHGNEITDSISLVTVTHNHHCKTYPCKWSHIGMDTNYRYYQYQKLGNKLAVQKIHYEINWGSKHGSFTHSSAQAAIDTTLA